MYCKHAKFSGICHKGRKEKDKTPRFTHRIVIIYMYYTYVSIPIS